MTSEPSGAITSNASTWAETFWKRSPVPCVPVETEPATVWRSMSPRFSNATPSASSMRLRSWSTEPASTLKSPDSRSKSSFRVSPSRRTIVPSVRAQSVNEWPEADARTRRPRSTESATVFCSAPSVPGRSIDAGSQAWSPAQFVHRAIARARLEA